MLTRKIRITIVSFRTRCWIEELIFNLLDVGDVCDDDADGDGVPNEKDNCPLVQNPNQEKAIDTDSKKGKACYNDFDGDGVEDHEDVCPENGKIQHTNFGNLMPMDLCKTNNIISYKGGR